ncbi:MAG: aminodeoxychorismate synthase component I [Kiritimatiellaeota bacterium]|nr:aminodeoxychorismate synthase component I [Kiritimatiellota bacterium]
MTNKLFIHDSRTRQWLRFTDPVEIVEAVSLDEVLPALRRVETAVGDHGLFAAGFLAYESAPAFDPALMVRDLTGFPLLWFGLYGPPERLDSLPPAAPAFHPELRWDSSVTREEYGAALREIRRYLVAGDTYQVNYTFRMRTRFRDDPWALFVRMAQAQQSNYAAFVDAGRFVMCSASPELFFTLEKGTLTALPMKGTAARGLTSQEDRSLARRLARSEKDRAENVMIVDMTRNDMGRIAIPGTVTVPRLFTVERYPTVWQMTSTVTAQTSAKLYDIMRAMFPCASITGAPKPRTMRIIAELETAPRRIYTGAIGFVTPQMRAQFNVAIRTVLIDREAGEAEYGVGGGIVWDSEIEDEYEECRIKARALTCRQPDFSLLETMLWTPGGGCFLLEYHMRRLIDSAAYFAFPVQREAVAAELERLARGFEPQPHKVRLLLDRDGTLHSEAVPLEPSPETPVRLAVAPGPVDRTDPFLYHKTTHRRLYDDARKACPEADDVLLYNDRGEITETTIANVLVRTADGWVTPPVHCGCLPGTYRAWLLDRGKVREQVVTLEEIGRAREVALVNSVRKWRRAALIRSPEKCRDGA